MSWLRAQPYLLLTLTTLSWSGNAVASRFAVGEISPMVLTFSRWAIVAAVFGLALRRQIAAAWPVLRRHWLYLFAMGALGYTVFSALFFAAAHFTSAINLTILQGATPVFVFLGALLAFRTPVSLLQIVGTVVTLAGVVVVASGGEWERFVSLRFNIGDVFILVAAALYSGYAVGLKARPEMPALVFFFAVSLGAALAGLPLIGWEAWAGSLQWPASAKGWAILLYIALIPSILAQLCFLRAVAIIGPGRAGLFANLVPVFGPIMAVLLLGERFLIAHGVGLALVLGGIALAEWRARPA